MTKEFPVYASQAEVVCFSCGATTENHRTSGNARHFGEYMCDCTSCKLHTWYDLQAPAKLGYAAFYNGKTYGLYANSLLDAKNKAVEHFKVPKSKQHMVSVILAEKDDKPVVHKPNF